MKERTRDGAQRRTPGQRAGLSPETIVATARRMVEDRGVAGVSIRSIAGELGVAPNALYTYFADKTAILDSVLDTTLGEIVIRPTEHLSWQNALAELMRASRKLMLAHPEMLPLFLSRSAGPNALRLGEEALRLLERGGIRGAAAVSALRALLAYSMGFVALEVPRTSADEPAHRADRLVRLVEALPASEAGRTRAVTAELGAPPSDSDFEMGLRALIAGIPEPHSPKRSGSTDSD